MAGHWEGDLITGAANRSAIATLVDRASGYTLLVHLLGRHTAEVLTPALTAAFAVLPAALCRSLTWDCGTELTDHQLLTASSGIPVFFADPHSPWQRGTNENTNGLLRQYFPKASDLSLHSPERLAEVAAELRPTPQTSLLGHPHQPSDGTTVAPPVAATVASFAGFQAVTPKPLRAWIDPDHVQTFQAHEQVTAVAVGRQAGAAHRSTP